MSSMVWSPLAQVTVKGAFGYQLDKYPWTAYWTLCRFPAGWLKTDRDDVQYYSQDGKWIYHDPSQLSLLTLSQAEEIIKSQLW